MTQAERSGTPLAAVLAVVGGALAAVGSLLTWASANAGGFSVSAKGLDGWEGKVTLVAGGIMLVSGIVALTGRGLSRLGGPALVGGLIAAGVGIYTAATAQDQVIEGAAAEIAKQLGLPLAQTRAAVQTAIDTGLLSIRLDVGLYVVIAGGLIGVVAAVLAWTASRQGLAPSGFAQPAVSTGWTVPAAAPPGPAVPGSVTPAAPDAARETGTPFPPGDEGGTAPWATEPPPPPPPDDPMRPGAGGTPARAPEDEG